MELKPKKLKILCLHGYRQNSTLFNSKIGGLRKKLKNYLEFFICDAPHLIDISNPDQRAWWFNSEGHFTSKTISNQALGFQESIDFIKNQFILNGPFDGILGFSQGASFAGIICSLKELKILNLDFKFAIMFSGFKSLCLEHEIYYKQPITMPTLHIFGSSDNVIEQDISKKYSDLFLNPQIEIHSQGHLVPNANSIKDSIINFIKTQE